MEKQLNEIYQTLQKLIGLHRQLLEVVRVERQALLDANLKAIQDATFAKQGLIENIRQAEALRLKHLGSLALIWKKPLRELTLSYLAIQVQAKEPAFADKLRSAQSTIALLVQRIMDQNRDNERFVQKSLEHVNEMKRNVLGEAVPEANTYGAQGQKRNSAAGARLISKEA